MVLPAERIDALAREAAGRFLTAEAIQEVSSRADFDLEGEDAVRILIVLKPNTAKTLKGDEALDALFEIKSRLREAGEQRTSIVEYAEVGEAVEADDGDSKS